MALDELRAMRFRPHMQLGAADRAAWPGHSVVSHRADHRHRHFQFL